MFPKLIIMAATATHLIASEPTIGPVRAEILSVYDGDTITVEAHIWPLQTVRTNVRIRGIDTPEIAGRCEAEKAAAIAARDFLRKQMVTSSVTLYNVELDKYGGRVVADVLIDDDLNVATMMIENKFARAYDGGKKESWCD